MPSYKHHSYNDISQANIHYKFNSYLSQIGMKEGKPREVYLNEKGDCNGWSFLFSYYNGIKKGQEFKDILNYIARWDNHIHSLNSNYGMSATLKNKYANGKQLFEQTINDVAWFSHLNTKSFDNGKLAQDHRAEQWQFVEDNKNDLHKVFAFVSTDMINRSVLPDMLRIASSWKNAWLDLGVYSKLGGHAISVYINSEGTYTFYDCNNAQGPFESYSSKTISQRIYNALGHDSELRDFSLYQFTQKEPSYSDRTIESPNPSSLNIHYRAAETFLKLALETHDLKPIYTLLSTDHVNQSSLIHTYGKKALLMAVTDGYTDLTSLLLENGLEANIQRSNDGKTPLMLAAQKGHIDIASLLVQHGADIRMVDYNGNSAQKLAYRYHHPDMVHFLEKAKQPILEKNFKVNDDAELDLSSFQKVPLSKSTSTSTIAIKDCITLDQDCIKGLDVTPHNSAVTQLTLAESILPLQNISAPILHETPHSLSLFE